jgi:hypothetical protein
VAIWVLRLVYVASKCPSQLELQIPAKRISIHVLMGKPHLHHKRLNNEQKSTVQFRLAAMAGFATGVGVIICPAFAVNVCMSRYMGSQQRIDTLTCTCTSTCIRKCYAQIILHLALTAQPSCVQMPYIEPLSFLTPHPHSSSAKTAAVDYQAAAQAH